ncbi:hypothetical protein HanIR_Chr17g0852751 [Helianthus annuus]|nr:hypothetical protein HanIR_Chr17g0852751 [Helianthus annuus]
MVCELKPVSALLDLRSGICSNCTNSKQILHCFQFSLLSVWKLFVSMSTSGCSVSPELEACWDEKIAFILKFVAIACILLAGFIGVAVPLVGKSWRILRSDSGFFSATKAFAAGVILSTGFVHILPMPHQHYPTRVSLISPGPVSRFRGSLQ